MFDFLAIPFMIRALIGGLLSGVLLGWLGVYVTTRKMSFIGDGIAHASLAAIAFALIAGLPTMPVAILFSMLAGSLLFILDKKKVVAQDTAIGILFTASLALGVVLLQFYDGFVPELVSFLFGNILAVSVQDLWVMAVVFLIITAVLLFFQRQLLFATVDPEGAYLANVKKDLFEYLLYIMTAVSIVVSVKLVGIVLVSGLLILPSAIARTMSDSFRVFQVWSVIISILIVMIGLYASYIFNVPSGASIILTGTLLFIPVAFIAEK